MPDCYLLVRATIEFVLNRKVKEEPSGLLLIINLGHGFFAHKVVVASTTRANDVSLDTPHQESDHLREEC